MNTDIFLRRGPARPRLPRHLAVVSVVIVAALALSGCGVRVGQPPGDVPSPDAAQAWRQELAVSAATVEAAAVDVTGPGQAVDIFADLAGVSGEYARALGGVWVPPPRDEAPSPVSPVPDVGGLGTVEAAAVLAGEAGAMLERALTAEPGTGTDSDPGTNSEPGPGTLASIWLSWHAAQVDLAGALGTDCVAPCRGIAIPGALSEPGGDLASAVHTLAPELIGIYDALGYVNGVLAARGDGAAAGVRATYREIAAVLAGDLDGTAGDPRQAAYALDPDPATASARLHADAADAWLRVLDGAPAAVRPRIIEPLWFHVDRAHGPGTLGLGAWPGLQE